MLLASEPSILVSVEEDGREDLVARKQKIHDAVQESTRSDADLGEAVLIGWVVVAEWMDGDGARWLSRMGSPADPSRSLPAWQSTGYLHYALTEDWDEVD